MFAFCIKSSGEGGGGEGGSDVIWYAYGAVQGPRGGESISGSGSGCGCGSGGGGGGSAEPVISDARFPGMAGEQCCLVSIAV